MNNKKIVLAIVLITVIAVSAFAQQYNDESDFQIVIDGNQVIITEYIGSKTTVNIPPVIQNLPVTGIGNRAGFINDKITSITIPNSVTKILSLFSLMCSKELTEINVAADNTAYTSENGILYTKDKTVLIRYPGGKTASSFNIPKSVTSIGDWAFIYCARLENVTIPNSVTSIGERAFQCCTSLTSVTIPNRVSSIEFSTFEYCTGLKRVIIPNSVTSIRNSAFKDCQELKRIIIPNSVTDIGVNAFNYCTSLKSVKIPNRVTSIACFNGCTNLKSITIPKSVTTIGGFENCTSLKSITIPNSVTSIEEYAFRGCTGLTAINVGINNKEYSSENGVLYNKDKTTLHTYPAGKKGSSFIIPNSIINIGRGAFSGCANLKDITISNNVTNVLWAFSGCTSLTAINVNSGNTVYSSDNGVLYNKAKTVLYIYPEGKTDSSFQIPNSITTIGHGAFSNCVNLTGITITDSVNSIGDDAFKGCTGLISITIPKSIVNIGKNVFSDCTSLTNVTLPDSVTSIGDSAFRNCTSLTSVTIPNGVTSIGDCAFLFCTSLTSVTFKGTIPSSRFYNGFISDPYPGDLRDKFYATDKVNGTPGTYTRESEDWVWTKQ